MPHYNLNSLGSAEFEKLTQSLLKAVIGDGTITFGAGKDGGREATFSGAAPYPSPSEPWSGSWIFQAKFHDTNLIGVDKARKEVIQELNSELEKITEKYKHRCDNYILITNVPLTGVAGTGNIDVIENSVKTKYRTAVPNIHIWSGDDVDKLLEKYSNIRTAYMHFLVPGDLIAQLMGNHIERGNDIALTIRDYISTQYGREQNAQLDQAGDVSEEPVRLQQVFFDLMATISVPPREKLKSDASEQLRRILQNKALSGSTLHESVVSPLQLLVSEIASKMVIVGGPGEGKSTIGQYLAQLHRSSILSKVNEVAIGENFIPVVPRIPFRITLRDFAQWLARHADDSLTSFPSLDEYLVFQVQQASKRALTVNELHKIIRTNPTLLILDGLDEVSGHQIRKIVLDRVGEFTDRCLNSLEADMQILASTRPTGYSHEFDPQRYLHFHLAKLNHAQVRRYVGRWIVAKELDDNKGERLRSSIDECLADPQISLLTNTPLQVTILLLIISGGGTPPRQREALFNEYLDIIFRRETAKGKNIISSEKEKLVGLHKYVGYLLHQRTTVAQEAGSELNREEYERTVGDYLRFCDPFTPPATRQAEIYGLTREAGERLVLIVEKRQDTFGFELRSIQEFFAACHLADTSADTIQRYKRFDAIAKLDHWRNVALFFAGRVGRNYSGESANIIEACRNLNRDSIGSHIKAGSLLALELAADRAFNHNRRQQKNLLEIGCDIISKSLSRRRREGIQGLFDRLPKEDVEDLLLSVLDQRIDLLSAEHLTQVPYILDRLGAPSSMMVGVIDKLKNDPDCRRAVFEAAVSIGLRRDEFPGVFLLATGEMSVHDLGVVLATAPWANVLNAVADMLTDGVSVDLVDGALLHSLQYYGISNRISPEDLVTALDHAVDEWSEDTREIALHATSILYVIKSHDTMHRHWRPSERDEIQERLRIALNAIPQRIIDGSWFLERTSLDLESTSCLEAVVWTVHLTRGNVTLESANAFLQTARAHKDHRCLFVQKSMLIPDLVYMLTAAVPGKVSMTDAAAALSQFFGSAGRKKWDLAVGQAQRRLSVLPESEQKKFLQAGLIGLSESSRAKFVGDLPEAVTEAVESRLVEAAGRKYDDRRRLDFDALRLVVDNIKNGGTFGPTQRSVLARLGDRIPSPPDAKSVSVVSDYLEYLLEGYTEPNYINPAVSIFCSHYHVDAIKMQFTDRVLDFSGRHHAGQEWYAYIGPNSKNAKLILQDLLPMIVLTPENDCRDGALALLISLSKTMQLMAPHLRRVVGVRFSGFVSLHRRLSSVATTDAERRLALLLFCYRKPSNDADWDVILRLLSSLDDDIVTRFVDFALSTRSSDNGSSERWLTLFVSLLSARRSSATAPSIVDAISTLHSEGNQSIAGEEADLDLPLPEQR